MRFLRSPLEALALVLLSATSGCAWPQLHVENVPAADGGELVLSGSGFTPNEPVVFSYRAPGNGVRRLGPVFVGEDGRINEYRYAYSFAHPYEGPGCEPSPGLQSDGRIMVVNAFERSTKRTTSGSVVVLNCHWGKLSAAR